MPEDFFEVDRLVEEHAKLYSTACATAWFRIERKKPDLQEYRAKVAEFMRHFEHTIATFPETPDAENFKDHTRKTLQAEIAKVLAGENKDVEKRHKYFVDYS